MGSKAKTDPKPERVPWDGLRFLKQTSQFITMPNPLARFDASKQPVLVNPGDVIWEPNSASNPFAWAPLDDVVMGGASQSGFNAATEIWKGTVTSANNGGFVGIRTTPFSPPLIYEIAKESNCESKMGAANDTKPLYVIRRILTVFAGQAVLILLLLHHSSWEEKHVQV